MKLRLLQDFHKTLATVQLLLRRRIQIRPELRKCRQFAVLRQVELERRAYLLGRLHGCRKTDARHRKTDVDRGTNARVEQIRFDEDLAVGDRDHIRWNVRGDVTSLRFDDRQSGQRSAAQLVRNLGGTLQEARVKIEHIARVRFAAWRTAQEQRDLTVRRCVLGQIVVDDQCVLAAVAEVLAHRGRRVGCQVRHRRRLGRGCGDNNGVRHRAVLFQRLHHLRHGRALLADRAVNADQVVFGRVDDRVERDCGLAGLAVTNQQFALAATNRDHGVDGLQAGRHGLRDRLTVDDAGRETFDGQRVRRVDGTLVVDRLAERVHHAADHRIAHRHAHDFAGALDLVTFADLGEVAQQHGADLVFVQVHGQAGDAFRELDQFAGHDLVQAVDACDAVAKRDDRADLVDGNLGLVVLNLLPEQFCDLVCLELCHVPFALSLPVTSLLERATCGARVCALCAGQVLLHLLQLAANRTVVHA